MITHCQNTDVQHRCSCIFGALAACLCLGDNLEGSPSPIIFIPIVFLLLLRHVRQRTRLQRPPRRRRRWPPAFVSCPLRHCRVGVQRVCRSRERVPRPRLCPPSARRARSRRTTLACSLCAPRSKICARLVFVGRRRRPEDHWQRRQQLRRRSGPSS